MHLVVFIPGIMGTRLALRAASGSVEEVWPPTPLETKLGYKRIDKLQAPAAYATEIIASVLCFQFYGTIFDIFGTLGFSETAADKRLLRFPYDWRQDLFATVDGLAARLDEAQAEKAETISIVAHSMGGLIARLLLEGPTNRKRKWFGKIGQLIALAVPHLGAPLALARILGLDSTLGVSGPDFARFAANPAYPSGYQLLPPRGEQCCWDQTSRDLRPIDIYDPPKAKRLGLKPALLTRAKAVHDVLGPGQPPKGVRYFYFGGTGHRTVTRINVSPDPTGSIDHESSILTRTADAGDGTVPLYSALPHLGQRQIVVNEHSVVFEGEPFLRVFVRLLGGNAGPAIERALQAVKPLVLSVESPILPAGSDVEIVMSVSPAALATDGSGLLRIAGDLVLERFDDAASKTEEVATIPLAYSGPPVDKLRLTLPAQQAPGHYRLWFRGQPETSAEVVFAVSAV